MAPGLQPMAVFKLVGLGFVAAVYCHDVPSAGDPLFLTPYLPDRYQEAQKASKIDLSSVGWNKTTAMHSGFFTIDKTLGKNSFFWYSEALDGNPHAPLLLWLTGGPGASSLFAMFTELGPMLITESGEIQKRAITWNEHYHMIFVDNPVGVGFSFTETTKGFATNEQQIGLDLHNLLVQFFQMFPHLRANDFYVTGESYAGKYVPACAYTVHMENQKVQDPAKRINLKGITIGDGAFDPPHQFQGFGDLLWNLGMVDELEHAKFLQYERSIQTHLDNHDTVSAFRAFDEMLNGDFYPYGTYYANVTGMTTNYFNFEEAPDATPLGGSFVAWLDKPLIRSQIHAGGRSYTPENETVEKYLEADWMRDVVDMLVPVMENYKVLVYSGQNDVILGPTLTENALWQLKWEGAAAYRTAKKVVWRLAAKAPGSQLPDVAGYAREVTLPNRPHARFAQVVIRGAGHMAPADQPARSYDMLRRFIADEGFGEHEAVSQASSPEAPIVV